MLSCIESTTVSESMLVSVVVELVSVAMAAVFVAMEILIVCSPGTMAIPRVRLLRSNPLPAPLPSTCSATVEM